MDQVCHISSWKLWRIPKSRGFVCEKLFVQFLGSNLTQPQQRVDLWKLIATSRTMLWYLRPTSQIVHAHAQNCLRNLIIKMEAMYCYDDSIDMSEGVRRTDLLDTKRLSSIKRKWEPYQLDKLRNRQLSLFLHNKSVTNTFYIALRKQVI